MPTSLTRWRETPLSFGPFGKVMLSFGLVLASVVMVVLRRPGVLFAIPAALRSIWRPRHEDG